MRPSMIIKGYSTNTRESNRSLNGTVVTEPQRISQILFQRRGKPKPGFTKIPSRWESVER